ncbi:dihydromonapterin reductase [Hydrogenovibrio kuenenii]|uniref:dihydromonapterin reductase n=1 Tax=Hydrogenovibrio kuenenii TaxID=63658 RepID=UPI000467AB69|nr:dihydromonapterin reductase [Hydrogenovibrio kuenenii]
MLGDKLENAVLITGAGQRIGRFLAQRFLDETDYPVIFTYRTERPAVEELKSAGALGIQVDFTHPNAVHDCCSVLTEKVQSLRAVIHNASLWIDEQLVLQKPELMQAMFDVHVHTPYQLNQVCLPLLQASSCEQKDIIALSDCRTSEGKADYAGYLSSKAALESLMLSHARAFAPDVKVNTIAPGLVCFNEGDSEDYKQKRLDESAIPKPAGMESIWQAVDFLMNSPTSTGSKIEIGQLMR